jgi:hypothetical protein
MHTINFPIIAPSASHNVLLKTIEFKMAAISVKRSIGYTSYAPINVKPVGAQAQGRDSICSSVGLAFDNISCPEAS